MSLCHKPVNCPESTTARWLKGVAAVRCWKGIPSMIGPERRGAVACRTPLKMGQHSPALNMAGTHFYAVDDMMGRGICIPGQSARDPGRQCMGFGRASKRTVLYRTGGRQLVAHNRRIHDIPVKLIKQMVQRRRRLLTPRPEPGISINGA